MALDLAKIEKQACEDFAPLFTGFWYPLQRKYFRLVLTTEKRFIILKAPRQSMKSFITALVAAILIVSGYTVILLAPIMQQSTDVIVHHITAFLEAYRRRKAKLQPNVSQWKRTRFYQIDNVRSKLLWNGGRMLAITGSPTATTDGLTGAMTIIDEAQDIDPEVMSLRIEPFTDIARQRAQLEDKPFLGKTIILGRGGVRTSYIETKMSSKDAEIMHITADDVMKQFPVFATTVEEAKRSSPEHIFMANYYGEPLPSDTCHIFAQLRVQDMGLKHRPTIGIDWGRKDYTAGVARFSVKDEWYVDDVFLVAGGSYHDMARRLAEWINRYEWMREDIICELNGVGDASVEILEKELNARLVDYGVFLDADEKHQRLLDLIIKSETGRMVVRDERIEQMLLPLTYAYDDRTRLIKAVHSDVLSALIMATPAVGGKVHEIRRGVRA